MIRAAMLALLGFGAAFADDDPAERITESQKVFSEIMAAPDKAIPQDLLERAHCIGIIPSLKKGGFIVGAQYGVGEVMCRGKARTGWTGPSTVKVEGGSLGLQIGGGEVDVVFLVMNERGAEKLIKSEFTLGGEVSAMAGPVGRTTAAETDAMMRAEILSWSRSRGVFAGAVLKGGTLRSHDEANAKIYGKPVKHRDILEGNVPPPKSAAGLLSLLNRYSFRERSGD